MTIRERPIPFTGAMTRAILEDRKTQTRRVIIPRTAHLHGPWGCYSGSRWTIMAHPGGGWLGFDDPTGIPMYILDDIVNRGRKGFPCPYGVPGDRLRVNEAWAVGQCANSLKPRELDPKTWLKDNGGLWYPADGSGPIHPISPRGKNRSSRFMPRWASRLLLEILDIRVQRVQDISDGDAMAEGVEPGFYDGGRWEETTDPACPVIPAFARLWDSINSKRGFGWDVNPWVFAIEFKRLKP